MRTSYHLMDERGPHTPSKANRLIPSESDALRGKHPSLDLSTTYGIFVSLRDADTHLPIVFYAYFYSRLRY